MYHPGAIFSETVAVNEPLDLLLALRRSGAAPLFYWDQPERGLTIAAAGATAEIRAAGIDRFRQVSERARALLASLETARGGNPGDGPLLVGGFGFSDQACEAREWREFPPAWIFLPRLLWVRRGTRCTLTRSWANADRNSVDDLLARALAGGRACDKGAPPLLELKQATPLERYQWIERVERSRARIDCGALQKVVLSRRRAAESTSPIDPAGFMYSAHRARPSCANFFVSGATTAFVGSTPEILVTVHEDTVMSGALAGSAPRGDNQQADRALGEALLKSAKNLEEHRYVVSAIKAALNPVAALASVPACPQLIVLPETQHLFTPVEGRLREPRSVIELAGLLHPTPAVCGVPREAARAIIEREEPDRGWYTGTVGWMDDQGRGEFAVALRTGIIDGSRMVLFAGAGIVAGSEPDAEFAETENKLTALFGSGAGGTIG